MPKHNFFNNEKNLGLLVLVLSFSVYLFTLCPTVYTGDSGELITACYTLGVGHPPGYPLYYLLGKLFTFIPLGSIAFRVNFLSAVSSSLAVFVLYLIITEVAGVVNPRACLINRVLPGICASLIYAFSDTFWSQAVVAEVYPLGVFMTGLAFLVLLRWARKKDIRLLYGFSFLYGLAITAHQLGLFFWLGFLVIVVSYEPQLFKRPKSIFLLLCFFLLGISIYLYIPLRAHFDPVLNWGKVHDIKSFVGYLLRSQYRGDTVPSNYSPWDVFSFYRIKFSQPGKLAHFLTDDFGLIWLVAFLGIVPLALKAKRYLLAILAIVLMGILKVWPPLSTDAKMLDIGRVYLVFGYLGLAILMGMGFFYLLEIVQRKAAKPFYLLFAIIISFSGCVPLWLNFSKNDLSNNFVAYNYGRNVLSTLDRNAVLLASGDNDDFILVYLTQVEKIRPDVVIYDDLSGDVFKRTPFAASGLGEGRQDEVLSALLKKNNNPLYMTFAHPFVANTWYNLDLVGVVYKVLQENERVPLEVKQRAWSGYDTAGVFDSRAEEISEYFMRMLISAYYIQYGDYLLSRDDPLGFSFHEEGLKLSRYSGSFLQRLVSFYIRHGMLRQAEYVSKEVSKAYPDNADIFYNLGVYYGRSGRYERAIASWEKAIKIKPDFKKAKEDLETAKQLIRDANLKADRNVQK